MITRPTVFVLGAGASADYDLPLGSGLVREVIHGMRGGYLWPHLVKAGYEPPLIKDFAQRLEGSDAQSVDAFLEGNRADFVELGKTAIAIVILVGEHKCVRNDRLFGSPPEDHWLRYVWNLMRAGATAETVADNRAAFVTFNYDRVLETYFETVLASSFNLPTADTRGILAKIPIIHLHGVVGARGFGEYANDLEQSDTKEMASGIRVLHEPEVHEDPQFARAHRLLAAAEQVCVLGFGFHPVNIERLAISAHVGAGVQVHACAFRMGTAELAVAVDRVRRAFATSDSHRKAESYLREHVKLL